MTLKGLFRLFKNDLWPFYALFVARFVSWFVIVCGMSKKLFLRVFLDEEKNPDC